MSEVDPLRQDLPVVEGKWQTAVAERDQARDQLAAANEELRVLNEEISDQNREIRQVNDELEGLLTGAGIPILMVDRNLAVKRISPAAEHPFNVRQSDAGCPLGDIKPRVDGGALRKLILRVLGGSPAEQQRLLDCDGDWQLLSVRPYRRGYRLEGAVVSLINIQSLHNNGLESVVESIPMPTLMLDSELRIIAVSLDFLSTFGLVFPALINRPVEDVGRNPFNAPAFKDLLQRLAKGAESEELDIVQTGPDASERAVQVVARRIHREQGHQFLITIRDITAQKDAHRIWAHALLDTEDALRLSHYELRSLAGQLLHAQDEERRRLSRELHDDLSQNVAALQFDVEALAIKLPPNLEKERRQLAVIRDSAEQLSNDLRRIAHGLHPSTLEVLGLPAALKTYAEDFSKRTGIVVEFTSSNVPQMIPAEVGSSLYRIAQEALRNVARHVAAGSASIDLSGEELCLTLSIRDGGPGFDRENVRGRGGLGLVSMEERARLIRAKFQLDTAPGKGVSITVSAPLG